MPACGLIALVFVWYRAFQKAVFVMFALAVLVLVQIGLERVILATQPLEDLPKAFGVGILISSGLYMATVAIVATLGALICLLRGHGE